MLREQQVIRNWQDATRSLKLACQRAGRNPQEVTLLAVTKYAHDADVLTLLKQGLLSDIGESRVQQAWNRWRENPAFAPYAQVKKHFIGHLQKNKIAKAAQLFDAVDSIDDFETAALLSKHLAAGKKLSILVQVKLTDKQTQSGLPLPKARQLAYRLIGAFDNVDVRGYMAVAPQGADENTLRGLFKMLKQAFDEDFKTVPQRILSLGMSDDFIIAVEEGSTLPRLGGLLFSRNLEEL